nr:hypothetical protein [Saprospiraceae bacterium]
MRSSYHEVVFHEGLPLPQIHRVFENPADFGSHYWLLIHFLGEISASVLVNPYQLSRK